MNEKIPYVIKKSKRAKRMRLTVYGNGSVVVTIPHGVKEGVVEEFIKEKQNWLFGKRALLREFRYTSIISFDKKDYSKHKNQAYTFVRSRVARFNKVYGYAHGAISIKNQKTRWGSCSSKGNLNFNYRILFLPETLRDYLIVHELCHLKEFNHSPKFWKLVARTIPDYVQRRNEMKKYGLRLIG